MILMRVLRRWCRIFVLTRHRGVEELAQAHFDHFVPHRSLALAPGHERNYGLGHVAMAPGAAEIAEEPLDRLAGIGMAESVIAHRDDQITTQPA